MQRALWDAVTPSLRGVAVKPTRPVIEARFIYEGLTEEDRQIVWEVEANVDADFNPPVELNFRPVSSSPPERRVLETGEMWVYLRREPLEEY